SLASLGLAVEMAKPELITTTFSDRRLTSRIDDISEVKEIFSKHFVARASLELPSARTALERGLKATGFDAWWTIEVFNAYEDLDDLRMDVAQWNTSSE